MDVPKLEYTLSLFVGNVERELQRSDHRTWTPTQGLYVSSILTTHAHRSLCMCRDVCPTSEMRAQIQMKSGHSIWAKYKQSDEVIDLQELFSDYWSSDKHEFMVPSES